MPKHERQQWSEFTFSPEEIKAALLAKVDGFIFRDPSSSILTMNEEAGTISILGYIGPIEDE